MRTMDRIFISYDSVLSEDATNFQLRYDHHEEEFINSDLYKMFDQFEERISAAMSAFTPYYILTMVNGNYWAAYRSQIVGFLTEITRRLKTYSPQRDRTERLAFVMEPSFMWRLIDKGIIPDKDVINRIAYVPDLPHRRSLKDIISDISKLKQQYEKDGDIEEIISFPVTVNAQGNGYEFEFTIDHLPEQVKNGFSHAALGVSKWLRESCFRDNIELISVNRSIYNEVFDSKDAMLAVNIGHIKEAMEYYQCVHMLDGGFFDHIVFLTGKPDVFRELFPNSQITYMQPSAYLARLRNKP